jgi:nickel/cobalt exporter
MGTGKWEMGTKNPRPLVPVFRSHFPFPRSHVTALIVFLLATTVSQAHPVPRGAHGRKVTVHLDRAGVRVEYRLDADQWTVVFKDLPELLERGELGGLRKPAEFYTAYRKVMGPTLAEGLVATLDGKPLTFRPIDESRHEVVDNHLQCLFVYEAAWPFQPGAEHAFRFREANFLSDDEPGPLDLSLSDGPALRLLTRDEPDAQTKARPLIDRRPGDEARLRTLGATLRLLDDTAPADTTVSTPGPPAPAAGALRPAEAHAHEHSLLSLLDSSAGLAMLLLLSASFGAVHALTPGHGKAMVAAYLVGERGTAGHAVFLGLVTTITHTGSVLAVAALLPVLFPRAVPADVQRVLGAVGGLLVAGLGFWLLLTRAAGQPDHVHLPGTGHHHYHGPGGHDHHYHHPPAPADSKVSWWGLLVLGVSGGLVPCWDAIAMLGFAIASQQLALALPLLLAFSAGLAAVLVVLGLGVVYFKRFAAGRFGEGRLFRALPVLSAIAVTILGLWLTRASLAVPPAG